ncbi:MAG TPA: lysophospholipid acyltransferase family protein [Pyrinomonadaceae bacterium]|jgi:1-acyl-sn-glycerol-3-phosphate acyltransferase
MLEANKSALFEKIFALYNCNLLKRRFHSLQVSGLQFLLDKNPNIPLIIYCNHSCWWDGLVAFQISLKAGLDSFLMMEEKHLRRLFLFRLLGAFSVVREKPREGYKSMVYIRKLLSEKPRRTLWIFPQGEILPNDSRPLKFYNGLTKIAEKLRVCSVASLSMRYEFLGEFKPRIFAKIEEPELFSAAQHTDLKQLTERFAQQLTENLEKLKTDVVNQNFVDYKSIF